MGAVPGTEWSQKEKEKGAVALPARAPPRYIPTMAHTLQSTIAAIVERSTGCEVPFENRRLALVLDENGRYVLGEQSCPEDRPLSGRYQVMRGGRPLAAGHALTPEEAEAAVRVILGLDAGPPRHSARILDVRRRIAATLVLRLSRAKEKAHRSRPL